MILNPVGVTWHGERRLSPRLPQLDGRTIGLLDDGFPCTEAYLRGVGNALAAQGAQVRYWIKPMPSRPAPAETLDKMVAACDAVIVGAAA